MSFSTTSLHSMLVFLLFSATFGSGRGFTQNIKPNSTNTFDVGVILDMGTWVGKISWICISMAIDDFYAAHPNHTTRLVLHLKDSKDDSITAASAVASLLKNLQVQAIIGLQTSTQAKFIGELANKSQTPIISFSATSQAPSSLHTPYFVEAAVSGSMQARIIADLVQSFGWTELIPIFEDSEYGIGMIPYLINALQSTEARISYCVMISPGANNDQILHELQNLKTMKTHVFVVHSSVSLVSRLFLKARETEMMVEGYTWIVTYGLTDFMDFMDSSTIDTLEGILTIKPYISKSAVLKDFDNRWREQFRLENPTAAVKLPKHSVYSLWAYDTSWALAMAAERLSTEKSEQNIINVANDYPIDLEHITPRPNGPSLLNFISGMQFKGLSGEFQLGNGQLDSTMKFEIFNIMRGKSKRIGFWTKGTGILRTPESSTSLKRVARRMNLMVLPKESKHEIMGKKLRIGVPVTRGFNEFVNMEWNPSTQRNGSGFCIEVFDMVVKKLPYHIEYEYIIFENSRGEMNGSYDDLIHQVYLKNFDAVVGDVTITPERSLYVDFTVPYTETGVSMVVPVKGDQSAWTFVKPLTTKLWWVTGIFFVYTGFVVWVLEHRTNNSFRGPPLQQIGNALYFSFATMVYAHREKLISNITKVVVIIWLFVVLILTSSYTASLSSMLTVQQLHPTVTKLQDLIRNGDYVGYLGVYSWLRLLHIDKSWIKIYNSSEGFDVALTNGSSRGGVGAIIAEIPYIKVFLSKYCGKYTMVGDVYRSTGFGFAFPKGSALIPDISREILKLQAEIDKKLDWNKTCSEQDNKTAVSLSFDSFWGLFLITGSTSTLAIVLFLILFFYEHRQLFFTNSYGRSIWQRLTIFLEHKVGFTIKMIFRALQVFLERLGKTLVRG